MNKFVKDKKALKKLTKAVDAIYELGYRVVAIQKVDKRKKKGGNVAIIDQPTFNDYNAVINN